MFSVPSAVLCKDSDTMVGEAAQSRQVLNAAVPPASGISHTPLVHDPDDGDDVADDDGVSTVSVTPDRSAVRSANFVYESYPDSSGCDSSGSP